MSKHWLKYVKMNLHEFTLVNRKAKQIANLKHGGHCTEFFCHSLGGYVRPSSHGTAIQQPKRIFTDNMGLQ